MTPVLLACCLAAALQVGDAPPPRDVPSGGPPAADAPQRPGPDADPAEREEFRRWWQGLDEEQRRRYLERWRRFRELDEPNREELERRWQALRRERERMLRSLSDEERRALRSLPPEERQRRVDELTRAWIARRGADLPPGEGPPSEGRPPRDLGERLERGRNWAEPRRREALLRQARRWVQEGWLGPRSLEWMHEAPLPELENALAEVARWRFLGRAARSGFWERRGIGEEERRRLLELPAPEFFRRLELRAPGSLPPGLGERPSDGGRREGRPERPERRGPAGGRDVRPPREPRDGRARDLRPPREGPRGRRDGEGRGPMERRRAVAEPR